jgi:hypothetical protein
LSSRKRLKLTRVQRIVSALRKHDMGCSTYVATLARLHNIR